MWNSVGKFQLFSIVSLLCLKYCHGNRTEAVRFHRLPKRVIPTSYDLQLLLPSFYTDFTYQGRVTIDIFVIEPTNVITLNYDGLNIEKEKTEFLTYEIDNLTILSQLCDSDKQFFTILFNQKLKIGNYKLFLYFHGEVRNDLFGFYKSSYKVRNETRWMGVTQFSQTFARRAFPCFDEPYMKATFQLHFGHYRNQTITSNTVTEQISPTNTSNYIITSMKKTPKMSTYLIGWSVHDFNHYESIDLPGFGLWARETMAEKGSLALQEGRLIYLALESYLNIENPIKKIDHVAISDFHFGAMENWGMITFRESRIIFDEKTTPTDVIHSGLTTMGHEYAHTWFGNLVTPEFWNFAWLKEGFATYFSYIARSIINPDNRMMDLFVVENLQSALLSDSTAHNRTMNGRGDGEADNIMGYADFNAYQKGSSIVRMISRLMGSESFLQAITSFLRSNLYSYITPEILYEHLQNYANGGGKLMKDINMREVIESYANQPGYPLITIKRNYSSGWIEILQERFNLHSNWSNPKQPLWWVPLSFVSKSLASSTISSQFGSTWLAPKDKGLMKINSDPQDWILCDIDKIGYYRVNYDSYNWNMLIEHLGTDEFDTIKPITRATLIDDAFNLAQGGYISYNISFRLINYLGKETEYEPWFASLKSLYFLNQIFQDLPTLRVSLQSYTIRLLKTIYQSFSFVKTQDSLREKLLRQLILSAACEMNHPHCLKQARFKFTKWINDSSEIVDPDLKSSIYCSGIRFGSDEDWKEVFSRFIQADLHTEKELLMKALGCSNNKILIDKFLNFSITTHEPEIQKQYRTLIVSGIINGNRENINYTLEFIAKNFEKIIKMRGSKFLIDVLNLVKVRVTSIEILTQFSSLVENDISNLDGMEQARSAVKYAERSIAWIKKHSAIIENSVNSQMYM
ncbi:aminopeptidase N-like [Cotesia glomerata]|nr:aminopeptidase N-like [Cotesia glomerata]